MVAACGQSAGPASIAGRSALAHQPAREALGEQPLADTGGSTQKQRVWQVLYIPHAIPRRLLPRQYGHLETPGKRRFHGRSHRGQRRGGRYDKEAFWFVLRPFMIALTHALEKLSTLGLDAIGGTSRAPRQGHGNGHIKIEGDVWQWDVEKVRQCIYQGDLKTSSIALIGVGGIQVAVADDGFADCERRRDDGLDVLYTRREYQ